MKRSDTEQQSASVSAVASTATTRLTGSWLIIARAMWLAIVVPSVILFVASLPVYYQQLQKACVDATTCSVGGTLTARGLEALSSSGFSASGYAALPFSFVNFLGEVSVGVYLLLFPNGRIVPRWMGLILLLVIVKAFFNNFPSPTSPFDANWPGWLYLLITGIIYVSLIFSQIYRYRRVSTPVQRQQTKWVVLGVSVVVGFYIGMFIVVISFFPSFGSIGDQNFLGQMIGNFVYQGVLLLIPLSFGFSILRYRLYDIDVLINRTLVYVGLVIGLNRLCICSQDRWGSLPSSS